MLLIAACGKKAEIKSRPPVREELGVETEMEARLKKQSVICEDGISCPGNLAKVVVVSGDRLKTCTGFLVNSVTLATSASCLNDDYGVPMESERCSKDVHVFLPRFDFSPAARLRCKEVIFTSSLIGTDPTLWRSDIAYLYLEVSNQETRGRRLSFLNREGLEDRKFFTLWKVDADTNELGVIRRDECQVVTKSYVNPLSDSTFSPVISMVGCEFKEGNTGGLILGAKERWRGILSSPLSEDIRNFLTVIRRDMLVEPLAPLIHVANGACLPSVIESNSPTELDCFKDLDENEVLLRRSEMLSTEIPHHTTRGSIAAQVNSVRPYFRWEAKLVQAETTNPVYQVELVPLCMNPLEGWINRVGRRDNKFIYSMQLPAWKLSLGFDRAARFVGRTDETQTQKIFVQFSPSRAASSGKTTVYVWNSGEEARTFRDVSVCQD